MAKKVSQPGFRIAGVGAALPEKMVTNDAIAKSIKDNQPKDYDGPETTAEWMQKATWIEKRPISDPEKGETTGKLGVIAGRIALEQSGLDPETIDVLVFATTTPDDKVPATAPWVQEELGLTNAYAYDINAACSGFVFGVADANAHMSTYKKKRVMVVGADTLDQITDYTDRVTAPLFSAGAGAIVMESTAEDRGLIGVDLRSKGDKSVLYCPHYEIRDGKLSKGYIKMKEGRPVFEAGTEYMSQTLEVAMAQAEVEAEEVRLAVLHQANGRMMQRVVKIVGIDESKMPVSIDHIGNSSSATIPITLYEAMQNEEIKPGEIVVMSAAGAGMTGGSLVLKW